MICFSFHTFSYVTNKILQEKHLHCRYRYTGKDPIEEKDYLKDLGVWMSKDRTFSEHIQKVIKTAKQMSGWILRTFLSRDPNHLLPLWKSLVVSKMEYACQLCCPYRIKDIQKLEQVQRVFTRKITNESLRYWDRFKMLGMYSLQRRRECYCIIYTWKIMEGMVPCPSPREEDAVKSQTHPRFGRTCSRKALTSVSQRLKTVEAELFNNFGPRLFNCLLRKFRDTTRCSTEALKRRLDKFLKDVPDELPIPHSPSPRGAASNCIVDQLLYMKAEKICGGGGLASWPW